MLKNWFEIALLSTVAGERLLRLQLTFLNFARAGNLKHLIVRHYKTQNEDTNFQLTRQPRSRKVDVGSSLLFCPALLSHRAKRFVKGETVQHEFVFLFVLIEKVCRCGKVVYRCFCFLYLRVIAKLSLREKRSAQTQLSAISFFVSNRAMLCLMLRLCFVCSRSMSVLLQCRAWYRNQQILCRLDRCLFWCTLLLNHRQASQLNHYALKVHRF